jgi:hypothetical protein
MAAQCIVKVDIFVTDLGSDIEKHVRYETTNTPEGVQCGYGTVAAANTYEAVVLGQVAASTIDLCYIKSIDKTLYVEAKGTTLSVADITLAASEACLFRPSTSTAAAVSILVMSATAEAKYEYLIVGQTS